MRKGTNRVLVFLVFIASIAAAEIFIRAAHVLPFILPAPSKVFQALWVGLSSGLYEKHLLITMEETLVGFALGGVLGVLVGTLVALNKYVEMLLYPYVVAFQSLPKVALAPLFAVWFGLDMTPKVLNAALLAFFPLLVNVIAGLRSVDSDRVALMRSLAATDAQIFWKLRLPNSMPYVFAGIDVAIVFSLIGAIVGELVGANKGLGFLMQSYTYMMDTSGMFSILVILAVVGLVLHKCVDIVRRRVLFWDPSEKNDQPVSA